MPSMCAYQYMRTKVGEDEEDDKGVWVRRDRNQSQRTRRAAVGEGRRMEEGSENEQQRDSIWNLHWGAASSTSSGASPSVGEEEDEEWGGGKASVGSTVGERRGLGGAGRTTHPEGGAAGRWGARLSVLF